MSFSLAVPLLPLAVSHYYLLSLVVTRCVTRCHSLSNCCTTRCHSLYRSLSLVVTRCHSLSFAATRCTARCHSLSLVVTRCHSLPLVVTRCTTGLSFYKRSNIHSFTYQKTLLDAYLLLVFKIVQSLQCTLEVLFYPQFLKNTKFVRIVLNHIQ